MKPAPPHPFPGKLVVLDGAGGTGKDTQADRLVARLAAEGLAVVRYGFPRYTVGPYGPLIRGYLDGRFGDPNRIPPEFASLPYALDRQAARAELELLLKEGKIVIISRYLASNLAYQGAKLEGQAQQEFLEWLYDYEHTHLGVLREDLLIFLSAPEWMSGAQADRRQAGSGQRTDGRDGHEQDQRHMAKVIRLYRRLADQFNHWYVVDCATADRRSMRSVDDIASEVYTTVETIL